ncbi:MAG: class I SAM-dependent methyltransferase [bacterium]
MNWYNILGNLYYYSVQKYARSVGATFLYLPTDTIIRKNLAKKFKSFKKLNQGSLSILKSKPELQELYRSSNVTNSTVSNIYNIEYSENKLNTCNYKFLNALLLENGFSKIVGMPCENLQGKKILDVGAGSGELESFLLSKGCNPKDITTTDVSEKSCKKISALGISTLVGRLENLNFSENYFDVIFLSYFIDYDVDQVSTFLTTSKILKSDGKIIFEGLLPCQPVLKIEQDKNKFITKGKSLLDDIKNIVNFFKQNAEGIYIQGMYLGSRFIHNRNGIVKLNSCFLVFIKK